jgi:4a-hydroxytetrahydrobiopterin dehydratase
MPRGLISPESAYLQLKNHPGWVVERHRIYRDLRLASFRDAIEFITRVGEVAERLDHHPNISLHEYYFVRLELYSHVADGITQRDIDLAIAIDTIAGTS